MKQKDIDNQIEDLKTKLEQVNVQMTQKNIEHEKTIKAYIKDKLDSDVKLGQLKTKLTLKDNSNTNSSQSQADAKKNKLKANNDQIIEDFINENEKHTIPRPSTKIKTTPFIYNWEIIDEITSEEANIHRKTSSEIDKISTLRGKIKEVKGHKS